MNILITGALGHIGSKLFTHLVRNKKINDILLIDNLSTNKTSSLFFLKGKYNFLDIDVRDKSQDLINNVKKSEIDTATKIIRKVSKELNEK